MYHVIPVLKLLVKRWGGLKTGWTVWFRGCWSAETWFPPGNQSLVVYPRSPYGAQFFFYIFINDLNNVVYGMDPQKVCRQDKSGSSWYTRWVCCYLDQSDRKSLEKWVNKNVRKLSKGRKCRESAVSACFALLLSYIFLMAGKVS